MHEANPDREAAEQAETGPRAAGFAHTLRQALAFLTVRSCYYSYMKTCRRCERELGVQDFNRDSQRRDGLFPWCRECSRADQRARSARKSAAREAARKVPCVVHAPSPCPDGAIQCTKCAACGPPGSFYRSNVTTSGRHGSCKACMNAATGAWRKRNPESRKATTRQYKRGVSPDRFALLLESQGGACPICAVDLEPAHAVVDHDHACCGQGSSKNCGTCVRGLLCRSCNTAIGLLADSPERAGRAAAYLRRAQ